MVLNKKRATLFRPFRIFSANYTSATLQDPAGRGNLSTPEVPLEVGGCCCRAGGWREAAGDASTSDVLRDSPYVSC
jgi:hypothetical protein